MLNTTVRVDRYVVDVLLRDLVGHDHRPSAFTVYLFLATRDRARHHGGIPLSYADLAAATGLSKSAAQGAIQHLKRRRLIRVERASDTATPVYEVLAPWRRG